MAPPQVASANDAFLRVPVSSSRVHHHRCASPQPQPQPQALHPLLQDPTSFRLPRTPASGGLPSLRSLAPPTSQLGYILPPCTLGEEPQHMYPFVDWAPLGLPQLQPLAPPPPPNVTAAASCRVPIASAARQQRPPFNSSHTSIPTFTVRSVRSVADSESTKSPFGPASTASHHSSPAPRAASSTSEDELENVKPSSPSDNAHGAISHRKLSSSSSPVSAGAAESDRQGPSKMFLIGAASLFTSYIQLNCSRRNRRRARRRCGVAVTDAMKAQWSVFHEAEKLADVLSVTEWRRPTADSSAEASAADSSGESTTSDASLEEKIYALLDTLATRGALGTEIFVLTVCFVNRMLERGGLCLTEDNWEAVLLASTFVAQQWCDDQCYQSQQLHELAPIFSAADLGRLQRAAMELLNWDATTSDDEFERWESVIHDLSPSEPCT